MSLVVPNAYTNQLPVNTNIQAQPLNTPVLTQPPSFKNLGGRPVVHKIQDVLEQTYEYLDEIQQNSKLVPSVAGLAVKLFMHKATLYKMANKNKKLSDALKMINALQEAKLQDNGLNQVWNARFSQFLLSANHGYKETTQVDNTINMTVSAGNALSELDGKTKGISDSSIIDGEIVEPKN